MTLAPADIAKRAAAELALELVEDGMLLGLGTGSTAAWLVRLIGQRMRDTGLKVTGVPTSEATARLAEELGIPLTTLDKTSGLDLTLDGADEFDPALDLIKGGGAALLREKIVASASARFVVIADAGKRVPRLGAFPLPVEVIPFGWTATREGIAAALADLGLGAPPRDPRAAGTGPLLTDEGNYILDLRLGAIPDAPALAARLDAITGVVEHGLFVRMTERVVLGHPDGTAETLLRLGRAGNPPPDALDVMQDEDA